MTIKTGVGRMLGKLLLLFVHFFIVMYSILKIVVIGN